VYDILFKQDLTPVTKLFVVRAPAVARKAQPGQFVIVRIHEHGERIPLTVADHDRDAGTLTLVVQEVGKTTMEMGTIQVGDRLASLTGPLGNPSEIAHYGTVLCVAGGFAIAPIYPSPVLSKRRATPCGPSLACAARSCCSGRRRCGPSAMNWSSALRMARAGARVW
jgi:ferredoxin-NADP reductase